MNNYPSNLPALIRTRVPLHGRFHFSYEESFFFRATVAFSVFQTESSALESYVRVLAPLTRRRQLQLFPLYRLKLFLAFQAFHWIGSDTFLPIARETRRSESFQLIA